MIAPSMRLCLFALLSVTSLPLACSGRHSDADNPARVVAAPLVTDRPAATAQVAFAIASGPCLGKAVGEQICDGDRLLRCADAAGEVALEQRCSSIERCDAERRTCAPACPSGSVYIPATGPDGFVMGKGFMAHAATSYRVGKGHRPDTDKPHRIVLTRPFCMDALEVTAGEIKPCIDAGACQRPNPARFFVTYPTKPDHPVNAIDWISARNFCERAGKSLPTEAQWEWAATGGDGRAYPWGDEPPTCERADFTPGVLPRPAADAGCHGGGPSKVGSHPAGAKRWPGGEIQDLAGNVWEWCLDNYQPYPDKAETDPDHLKTETGFHVVRGGGWNRSGAGIQAAFRGSSIYTYQVPGLGFRCVKNAQ